MRIKVFARAAALVGVASTCVCTALARVEIPTVPVGNLGNAPDPSTGSQYGSVAYRYNIGTTEVTNAQYTEFLNAVARSDTYGLYNIGMSTESGGIIRTPTSVGYTYAVVPGRGNNPVNFVGFWDATRFANWLHNGQPSGQQVASTTEGGAYTLTASGINSNTVARNSGWQWAIPTENEWYKAAYHQPASQGGNPDNYWDFATRSNDITTSQANYNFFYANTTPVGSFAPSYYGTYDMSGNVFEFNEFIAAAGLTRGFRGGAWDSDSFRLRSLARSNASVVQEEYFSGFRVVQLPSPSVLALFFLSGSAAMLRRRGLGQ